VQQTVLVAIVGGEPGLVRSQHGPSPRGRVKLTLVGAHQSALSMSVRGGYHHRGTASIMKDILQSPLISG
jgi:hypothetical protein